MNCPILYSSQNPGILTNGLVTYWSFENPNSWLGPGVTIVRDLVSTATGSVLASAQIIYNINTGSVYSPPGGGVNRRLLCQSNAALTATGPSGSSWCFWTNLSSSLTTTTPIFQSGGGTNNALCYMISGSGGIYGLQFQNFYVGSNLTTTGVTNLTGWHFWTVTTANVSSSASSSVVFYQDGNQLNTVNNVYPITAGSDGVALYLGGTSYVVTPFRGWLNSFFVYNRTLTPAEVLYNYNATKWRFMQ